MNGFVCIYKPKNVSSAYCVNKVKRKFNCPCGHMGTLDPMASGILPVAIGKTCRLFDYLLDKEKEYVAEFQFGYETDTLDALGKTTKIGGRIPSFEEIKSVLYTQIGEIDQVPPKFSAKNVNGKRSYELARKGVEFELPSKKVNVIDIFVEKTDREDVFRFVIKCKGGTYIRSICRDIAKELGTYATMTSLERTKCGIFTLDNIVTLDDLISSESVSVIPQDSAVNFEKIILSKEQSKRLLNGVYDSYDLSDGLYKVYSEEEFWGIGIVCDKILKMKSYCR